MKRIIGYVNTYYSADLDGMIILIDSHTLPEEEQGFF